MGSSDTLGGALHRASRYSQVTNEAIVLKYREGRVPTLRLLYSGIPRHTDRHQIEFCIVAMIRLSRELSGRQFLPQRVSMIQARSAGRSKFARFLGKNIEFSSDADEITFPAGSADWALVNADPRLNKILLKVCEETLSSRKRKTGAFRITVENTIAPIASPWPSARECRGKKARYERALAGASACRGGRNIHRGPAPAEGELGQPLSGGRWHADFEDRLASRFRGGKLI